MTMPSEREPLARVTYGLEEALELHAALEGAGDGLSCLTLAVVTDASVHTQ